MNEGVAARIGTILKGTASGLFPMAIFTPVYAVWPVFAWRLPGLIFLTLAVAWSLYLAGSAVRVLRLSRGLPQGTNADDDRITKGMTIVSSIQGGLILASVVALAVLGQWEWILPVVVLIVALHFFPMPVIFRRTIDYYLGTAMLIVALVGLVLVGRPDVPWQTAWGIVGLGAALVTSGYGLWMRLTAKRVLTEYQDAGARRAFDVTPQH